MSAPFSHNFITRKGLSGTETFLVPASRTAVVKCCTAFIDNSLFQARVFFENGTHDCTFTSFGVSTGVVEAFLWFGSFVIPEGETLLVRATGNPWDVTVSGYLLTA
jgi:hypothetical protein